MTKLKSTVIRTNDGRLFVRKPVSCMQVEDPKDILYEYGYFEESGRFLRKATAGEWLHAWQNWYKKLLGESKTKNERTLAHQEWKRKNVSTMELDWFIPGNWIVMSRKLERVNDYDKRFERYLLYRVASADNSKIVYARLRYPVDSTPEHSVLMNNSQGLCIVPTDYTWSVKSNFQKPLPPYLTMGKTIEGVVEQIPYPCFELLKKEEFMSQQNADKKERTRQNSRKRKPRSEKVKVTS